MGERVHDNDNVCSSSRHRASDQETRQHQRVQSDGSEFGHWLLGGGGGGGEEE